MSNFQANEVFSQFFGGNDPFGNHEDIFNIFLNMNQNQSQFNGFSGNFPESRISFLLILDLIILEQIPLDQENNQKILLKKVFQFY